ncbi:MAG: undecaprenyl-diphosphate phosphatase [bacterium]
MSILQTIIFGIVEGVTEFLPISSTGHLILTADLLKISQTDFLKTFEISIQLGAILAVVVLYWRKLFVEVIVIKRIITAFIPTAVLGLAFYKIIKTYLMGNNSVVLWSLFLGGIFLVIFELILQKKEKICEQEKGRLSDITYKQSVVIGIFQSIAMIPGVSRSASTVVGGLVMGLSRKTIVEFSFLLAVPTMAAATGLDLLKNAGSFSSSEFVSLMIGFVISFLVALVAIKWLLNYIQKHSFIAFGVYRIIVALAFWLIIS